MGLRRVIARATRSTTALKKPLSVFNQLRCSSTVCEDNTARRGDSAQCGEPGFAIASAQLGDGVCSTLVCHPDVLPVKCQTNRNWTSGEHTQGSTVAWPQLTDGAVRDVRYPDIAPIKRCDPRKRSAKKRQKRGLGFELPSKISGCGEAVFVRKVLNWTEWTET